VGLGDRVRDREPQADASVVARAGRVGAGEALEDPAEGLGVDPATLVCDLDHDADPCGVRPELDQVARLGVGDGILEKRVEGHAQGVGVGRQMPTCQGSEMPGARRDLGPADEHVLEERLELEFRGDEKARPFGRGQQEQPVDDPVDPPELVERDLDLRRGREQLEVASCDRHRCAELVRGVVDEALLLLQQRLGDAERDLAAPRVPDHREEHRRHQRHLEQLAPELDPFEGVGENQRACPEEDHGEHERRRRRAPHTEAVEQRQADPDEVERDRLPARPDRHRRQVRGGEDAPGELEAASAASQNV